MVRCPASLAVASLCFLTISCGGGSGSPTGGGVPTPSTTLAPAPTPTPTPPPSSSSSSCPLGKGTTNTDCRKTQSALLQELDEAIELLVAQQPGLFDFANVRGTGGYFVKDHDGFYEGLVGALRAAGLCSEFDFASFNVKNTNEFSERYDLITSSGHLRRGIGSYEASCYPASFPVDPSEVIAYVRVAFFGFKCEAGVTPPPNALGKLPLACEGHVTASPKDANGTDVDPRIHGSEITWNLRVGSEVVRMEHFEGQPFNWILLPRQQGLFQLCATVQGVEGCLNGEVIP